MSRERKGIPDVQMPFLALRKRHQLASFDRVEHHRFLDHHVGSGEQRVLYQPIMGVMRCDHHHSIWLERQEIHMIGEGIFDTEARRAEMRARSPSRSATPITSASPYVVRLG